LKSDRPSSDMNAWFHLAYATQLLFWILLIVILSWQVFGSQDMTQKNRDTLHEQSRNEHKSDVITLIQYHKNIRTPDGLMLGAVETVRDEPLIMPDISADAQQAVPAGPPKSAGVALTKYLLLSRILR